MGVGEAGWSGRGERLGNLEEERQNEMRKPVEQRLKS